MREEWREIPEFPYYQISNLGNVYNQRFEHMMRTSLSTHGHPKVTLTFRYGWRVTRSVALLVAQAFVEPPDDISDQLIRLDGDITNMRADNLAWRPQSFAWNYMHQLKHEAPLHFRNLKVRNLMTGVRYESIVEAGMTEGLLFVDIWRSTYSGSPCYPHGSVFLVIERV